MTILGVGDITYPSYTLNRPDSVTFPGGSSQSYTYDDLMRLERIASSPSGMDYQYTSYDGVSNLLTKQTEHGNYVYDYDDVYRMTDVDNPTLDDEAYTYDGVGNRETASGVSGSITHNANNELTVYGDISYDYDANGNLTEKTSASESWEYTYNVQNRLVQVEEDDLLIAEYGYDPFGRRLWKEVDGVRTYFLYAEEGVVAEYDEAGNDIRSYGYRPDSTWTTNPLWLKEDGEYYWYQNDHLGTPQKLVDSTGTVVWSAQYTAFGEAVVASETVTNNLRFPGQYYDDETGLHDNFHRYYDPRIGRYLRTDPIGFTGGDINLYAYVWNSPVNWVDQWGLRPMHWWPTQYGPVWPPLDQCDPIPCQTSFGECYKNCLDTWLGQPFKYLLGTSIIGLGASVGSYPVNSGGNTWPLLKYLGYSIGMPVGSSYAKFMIWFTGTTTPIEKTMFMLGYKAKVTAIFGELGGISMKAGQITGTILAGWGIGIVAGCATACTDPCLYPEPLWEL